MQSEVVQDSAAHLVRFQRGESCISGEKSVKQEHFVLFTASLLSY